MSDKYEWFESAPGWVDVEAGDHVLYAPPKAGMTAWGGVVKKVIVSEKTGRVILAMESGYEMACDHARPVHGVLSVRHLVSET